MKRKSFLLLPLLMFLFLLVGCDNNTSSTNTTNDNNTTTTNNVQQHEHEYSKEWAYDENEHWHVAVCEHDEISNKGNHKFNTGSVTKQATEYETGIKTYRCQVCGYEKTETIPVVKTVTYKVTFDLDGGTSNSYIEFIEMKSISPQLLFYDVEKIGYNFRGWSIGGQLIYDQYGNTVKSYILSSNVTLKAVFSNKAMLTLKPNMENAGTLTGSNEYTYNTNVDINATPSKGYEFVGWYYSGTLLSNQQDYRYKMWDKDITIEAKFKLLSYNLTVSSNNIDSGLVLIGTGTIKEQYTTSKTMSFVYTQSVTVSAYTLLANARFLGWYDSDSNKLVTPDAVYTFPMLNRDYNLVAKWEKKNYFSVSLENDSTCGTVTGNGSYVEGSRVTITATPNSGYKFVGWYNGDTQVSSNPTYSFTLKGDISYSTRWEVVPNSYSVTLSTDSSYGTVTGGGSYQEGQTVTITATSNSGYIFDGWYNDYDDRVSTSQVYSFAMPSQNVRYTAKWKEQIGEYYSITLSTDSTNGTVFGDGSYQYEEYVTIKARPNSGYKFDGWYNGSNLVSMSLNYTFKMPSYNISYTAYFSLSENYTSAEMYTTDKILNQENGAVGIENFTAGGSSKILGANYVITNLSGESITTSYGYKLDKSGIITFATAKSAVLTIVTCEAVGNSFTNGFETPKVTNGTDVLTPTSTSTNEAGDVMTYVFNLSDAGSWQITRAGGKEVNPILYVKVVQ